MTELDDYINTLAMKYPAFARAFGKDGIAQVSSSVIASTLIDLYAVKGDGTPLDADDLEQISVAFGALAVKLKLRKA